MRIGAFFGGLTLAVALAAPADAAGALALADPVKAELVADTGSIVPGNTFWVDLHLAIAPGWHTYWRNPGDSGLPTEIAWKLPRGFQAGAIVWPVPERFVVVAIGNYGYAGSADLLVPIGAPADLKPGDTAHLAATATWLVCSQICIPGSADLALDLPVAASPAPPAPTVTARFAAARRRLPTDADFTTRFAVSRDELRLSVPADAVAGEHVTASFFPFDDNVVDAAAEPRTERHPDGLDLVLRRATGPTSRLPATLAGVLVVHDRSGAARAYTIAAPQKAASALTGNTQVGWWQALLLAFVGGAILNLMPCVFPILSLKLLGLAAAIHRAEERRHAAGYAAGVIVSFALLGGMLLLLREGGAAVGWGFQLQSPIVVALLAYLLFAMGLSLSGVAEFGVGLTGLGGGYAARSGIAGAFTTGILATIVATPCTAPFMGTALGFALIAPAPLGLAVFVAIGGGLAAPVVLAALLPGIARLVPQPGPWMVWFKRLLAFPLYATVAWLLWVLLQEVAPANACLVLVGLVAVGFAVWIYGRTRLAAPQARRLGSGIAAAGTAAALVIAVMLTPAGPSGAAAVTAGGLGYERFTPARLARLEDEHRPVFVNLTAAWCLTCLVNERTTLDSDAVRRAFSNRHIAALKGDWTRQDPAITAFLLQYGRSGVPLYLLYDKKGRPTVLPQILTEASMLDALGKI